MSTIRFSRFALLEIRDVPIPWQTPFASISAGTSVSRSPMTLRNSRSSGAPRSRSRSRRSSSTTCARAGFTGATRIRWPRPSSPIRASSRRRSPASSGWALFCDCDFLWLGDIAGLAAYAKGPKAVYCVQHDYRPKEKTKMDGAVQTVYPRKNWSSLMLFNCDHPSVRALTPEVVNRESGAYLHRMQWVADDGHRRAAGRMELARRLEREAGAAARRAPCISPAAGRGSSSGRTSTTAICGARSATICCSRKATL